MEDFKQYNLKEEDNFKTPEDAQLVNLENLTGLFETTTTAPTATPKTPYEQIKLVVDSLSAPSTFTLYVYINKINAWKSVSLS